MENFVISNPTVLHFGRDVIQDLGNTVSQYGKRVLLVYGKGSVKKSGLYQQIMAQLTKVKAEVFEYSGIRPNPIVDDVDAAASLGRAKGIEVILAVGGGSVIDSAKVMGVTIPVFHSAWDFFSGRVKPTTSLPVIAVLTLAATGSEMNQFAVLQNNRTKNKQGLGHRVMYPVHSFLDPALTFSVPRDYTAYGLADIIAHSLEAYFGKGEAPLSDQIVFSILKEINEIGPKLINDLENYDLRARAMYASTLALNGLTLYGRVSGDWGAHSISHVLSVLYDIPHGAALSITYPAWLKLKAGVMADRIRHLGKNVYGVDSVEDTIEEVEKHFRQMACPVRLSEVDIVSDRHPVIFEYLARNKVQGAYLPFEEYEYVELIEMMA